MRVQLVDHFGGNLNVASDLNNLRLVSLQTKPNIPKQYQVNLYRVIANVTANLT